MKHKKTLQELTIKDNFMFGAVMTDDALCKEFLELVLGFPISQVTVSKEKSIVYHPQYRGVRLDVIAADENHTHYNVEMQIKYKKDLGKRSRYYHSHIDMELLLAGSGYELLPDSYVIFICDFDPFLQKKYRYTFDAICREDHQIFLKDGSHTIFLSTCGENENEVPTALVNFLKYVKSDQDHTVDFKDEFIMHVEESVRKIKANHEMEEQYMFLEELIKDEKEESREEGKIEGRREGEIKGRREGKAEIVLDFLSDLGDIPTELQKQILEESDPEMLLSYLKKASKANSVEEFMSLIQ